jgi:hypothetical protein
MKLLPEQKAVLVCFLSLFLWISTRSLTSAFLLLRQYGREKERSGIAVVAHARRRVNGEHHKKKSQETKNSKANKKTQEKERGGGR